MSRMLSYIADEPLPASAALGTGLLAEFLDLSRLHADGWGTAWRDPTTGAVRTAGAAAPPAAGDAWTQALALPATARMIYLRFASRGAPAVAENVQPFHRGGSAFQHNGLLSPREDVLALLSTEQHAALRGTTDSEAYFAVIRASAPNEGSIEEGVVSGVRRVRSRFPRACLNAMLLTSSGLTVIHAAGSVVAPSTAFAERGFEGDALPPGHDGEYNVLRTTVGGSGARIVATTGVDQRDWTDLPGESVFSLDVGSVIDRRL